MDKTLNILAFLAVKELIKNLDFSVGKVLFLPKSEYENFLSFDNFHHTEEAFIECYGLTSFFKGFEVKADGIEITINQNEAASFIQMLDIMSVYIPESFCSIGKVSIVIIKATYSYISWRIHTYYSTPVGEYVDYIFSMAQADVYLLGGGKNIPYALYVSAIEYADFLESIFD